MQTKQPFLRNIHLFKVHFYFMPIRIRSDKNRESCWVQLIVEFYKDERLSLSTVNHVGTQASGYGFFLNQTNNPREIIYQMCTTIKILFSIYQIHIYAYPLQHKKRSMMIFVMNTHNMSSRRVRPCTYACAREERDSMCDLEILILFHAAT